MKHFQSTFSNAMLVSTILVCLLLVYALYAMVAQLPQYSYTSFTFWGISLAFCLVVLTMIYAFTQQLKTVTITDTDFIIQKMYGNIIIPINEIQEVSPKAHIASDIRVCGISGLFGHIGWFSNKQTGRYFALVKDGDSMLTIRTKNNKCYVISCKNHLQALDLLQKLVK